RVRARRQARFGRRAAVSLAGPVLPRAVRDRLHARALAADRPRAPPGARADARAGADDARILGGTDERVDACLVPRVLRGCGARGRRGGGGGQSAGSQSPPAPIRSGFAATARTTTTSAAQNIPPSPIVTKAP